MLSSSPANTLVVFDFETTGMSPDSGDRSIEVGAVKLPMRWARRQGCRSSRA